MSNSWEKVRSFLDTMDIQDLRSALPSSFSSFSSSSSSNSDLQPLSIDTRRWQVCERTAQQILSVIQPDAHSEDRRNEIIEYLQRLIEGAFGIKVFSFGSVPLKTYLPHGDIDLTVVGQSCTGQDLAAEVCSLLENEEKNNTCIQVKDVLYVPAQVRVVKCTVGGICVDISVNQTAGLSAFYFLDQVDLFIGKHHLFKRSVILIKAWCYYESRILGGFHGLISTYALETMVLHVLNLFHSSLDCPSAVLYKFLDYYSTFDWNSYCIGFNGLVPISSLPELVVQLPNDCDDLLLTDAFLRSSRETILSSTNFSGTNNVVFPVKFLNILDPLREDNNLGRSVSKGNFYRIRSALTYGARKLSDILVLPLENIKSGLENFFKDTLELNGKGRRADALVPVSVYDSDISSGNGGNDHLLSGLHYGMWFQDYGMLSSVVPDTSANQQVWNNQWADMNQNAPIDQSMYYSITRSPPSYVDGFKDFRFARGLSVTEKWRSRGTGTYIPHFEHLVQRDIIVEESEEEHESENEQESGKDVEISACTPRDINPSNEGGNIDMFNFSIEEFPLLPGSKPIPIQVPVPIQVSPWNYPEPEQVKDTSASLDSLEFDSIKQSSPTSLSLSEVGKQSDSDVSVVLDLVSEPTTTLTIPEAQESSKIEEKAQESSKIEEKAQESSKIEEKAQESSKIEEKAQESSKIEEKAQESSKIEEKVEIPVQPLLLEDDKEFPPLCRPPEPVITLNKKEFPPLRACLKSQKRGNRKKVFK